MRGVYYFRDVALTCAIPHFSGIRHLEQLKETGVKPVVNQLELHPWCQQREIAKYCQDNGQGLARQTPSVF